MELFLFVHGTLLKLKCTQASVHRHLYTGICIVVTYLVHVGSSFLLTHCVQYGMCKFVFLPVSCVLASKH